MVIEKPNLRDIRKVGSKSHVLKGWKYAGFIGAIVGFIGISKKCHSGGRLNFTILTFIFLAIYPIIIDPMMNPEKYKKQQAVNRKVSL